MKTSNYILLLHLAVTVLCFGQQPLTKEEALARALEQNFGIQVSRNTTAIQKNNSSILNSGYLPSVSLS